MFSAVTDVTLPVALPPTTPSPVKSRSLITGPADGGGMFGGTIVGGARVWNPFGTSTISSVVGGGGSFSGGGGGGGGGGGSGSSAVRICAIGLSSAIAALTRLVAQSASAIITTWNTADTAMATGPPRSFFG